MPGWFAQGVITGVVGNVLTSFLPQLRGTTLETELKKVNEHLQRDVGLGSLLQGALADLSAKVTLNRGDIEKIKQFLASPEVESIARALFSSRIAFDQDDRLASARKVFEQVLQHFLGSTAADIPELSSKLFEMVTTACRRALELASEKGVLAVHSAMSAYQTRILQDEIANLSSNLGFLQLNNKNYQISLEVVL